MTIGPFDAASAAVAVAASAAAFLLLVSGAGRRFVPEALAVTALGVAAYHAAEAVPPVGMLGGWLGLVGLAAAFPAAAAWMSEEAPSPVHAAFGGALFGALPWIVAAAPRCADGRSATRLALVATATGLLSPLGHPARLLLAPEPLALGLLGPVALVGLVAAWPRRARSSDAPNGTGHGPASWPPLGRPVIAAVAAALAASAIGPAGALLMVFGVGRARTSQAGSRSPGVMSRVAAASGAIALAAGWAGTSWWLGRALVGAPALVPSSGLVGVAWLTGALTEPMSFAALLGDAGRVVPSIPLATRATIALGAATAPTASLFVVAGHHGVGSLRHAIAPVLLVLGAAAGWVMLAPHSLRG